MEQPVERSEDKLFNTIITPTDQSRWSILEMQAQSCALPLNDTDKMVISLMEQLLNKPEMEHAVGLAAPQVGYSRQIFLMKRASGTLKCFVNPIITWYSLDKQHKVEGCLSLPGMIVKTSRAKQVTVSYLDECGVPHQDTFSGREAQIIQHEVDHVGGTLLRDHLNTNLEKKLKTLRIEKTKKQNLKIKNREKKKKFRVYHKR